MDRFIVVYETLGGKKKSESLNKKRAYEFCMAIRDTCLWAKIFKDCEVSDTPSVRPEYIVTWKDSEGVHVQKRDDVTRAWFFYKSIEHCEWKKLTEEPSGNVLREFPIRPVVKVEDLYEEVRCDYHDDENHYTTIDAWEQGNDEGKVVAVVHDSGDVWFIDNTARASRKVMEAIDHVKEQLKADK